MFNISDIEMIVDNNDYQMMNFSDPIWLRKSSGEMAWKITLFLPILILSVVGNSLIIYVIFKFPQSRNCTNLFICNMAIADFFATFFCAWAILTTNLYQNYVLGSIYCQFEGFSKGKTHLKLIGLKLIVFNIKTMKSSSLQKSREI